MKNLANNRELYEYLLFLASELKKRGAAELGEIAAFASRLAPYMSTEFLGESRIALQRILDEENGILDIQERTDMRDIIEQINVAFKTKGTKNQSKTKSKDEGP